MSTLTLIAEAVHYSDYSHVHLAWLVRTGRVKGKKLGGTWLIDLESLKEYEKKMQQRGVHKHDPKANLTK